MNLMFKNKFTILQKDQKFLNEDRLSVVDDILHEILMKTPGLSSQKIISNCPYQTVVSNYKIITINYEY